MTARWFCIVLTSALLVLSMPTAWANKPCSGSKGGIAHRAGDRIVCHDGSISGGPKKVCSIQGGIPKNLQAVAPL
ncbi:hypothetical protein EKL30_14890 [Candidimonas sp. SYP-B2681]|nr:hypothetical protein EKL30_14890 [Candidimonas sp. SYP-B2681]